MWHPFTNKKEPEPKPKPKPSYIQGLWFGVLSYDFEEHGTCQCHPRLVHQLAISTGGSQMLQMSCYIINDVNQQRSLLCHLHHCCCPCHLRSLKSISNHLCNCVGSIILAEVLNDTPLRLTSTLICSESSSVAAASIGRRTSSFTIWGVEGRG